MCIYSISLQKGGVAAVLMVVKMKLYEIAHLSHFFVICTAVHMVIGKCTPSSCTQECYPSKFTLSMSDRSITSPAPSSNLFQNCGREIFVLFIVKYHHGETRQRGVDLFCQILRTDRHSFHHKHSGTRPGSTGTSYRQCGSKQLQPVER